MNEYEAPSVTEIGSVADVTRGDWANPGSDNLSFLNDLIESIAPGAAGFGGS